MKQLDALPRIDQHEVLIRANVDVAWQILLETLERSFSRTGFAIYASVVGCADTVASGPRPLVDDSTLPGFHVLVADPGSELLLSGEHRFSSYAFRFLLETVGAGSTLLRAETRASFPGPAGALYRLVVIRTGGHAITVRHLLGVVKSHSEGLKIGPREPCS
jgi:hypothetical protein